MGLPPSPVFLSSIPMRRAGVYPPADSSGSRGRPSGGEVVHHVPPSPQPLHLGQAKGRGQGEGPPRVPGPGQAEDPIPPLIFQGPPRLPGPLGQHRVPGEAVGPPAGLPPAPGRAGRGPWRRGSSARPGPRSPASSPGGGGSPPAPSAAAGGSPPPGGGCPGPTPPRPPGHSPGRGPPPDRGAPSPVPPGPPPGSSGAPRAPWKRSVPWAHPLFCPEFSFTLCPESAKTSRPGWGGMFTVFRLSPKGSGILQGLHQIGIIPVGGVEGHHGVVDQHPVLHHQGGGHRPGSVCKRGCRGPRTGP